jgi:hypothetical protein
VRVTASPMPFDAPVTTATRPSSCRSTFTPQLFVRCGHIQSGVGNPCGLALIGLGVFPLVSFGGRLGGVAKG